LKFNSLLCETPIYKIQNLIFKVCDFHMSEFEAFATLLEGPNMNRSYSSKNKRKRKLRDTNNGKLLKQSILVNNEWQRDLMVVATQKEQWKKIYE